MEQVASNIGSQDVWDTSVHTNHMTDACIRMLLEDKWLDDNGANMTKENLTAAANNMFPLSLFMLWNLLFS